jgi:TspO/MBR family protein
MTASAGPGSPAISRDLRWAVLVLFLAITQVLSPPLTPLMLGAQAGTGEVSDANRSPLTPASYAFAIWGLIYLASMAYAIYQLMPAQRSRDVHRATRPWTALAFAASTTWVPIFGAKLLVVAQVVIFILVAALAIAVARYARVLTANRTADRFLVGLPITTYLGWATVASVAGLATTGVSLGAPADAGWVTPLAVAVVALVAAVIATVAWLIPAALGFVGSSVWGLAAIGVGTDRAAVSVAAYASALIVVAVLVTRLVRTTDKTTAALG